MLLWDGKAVRFDDGQHVFWCTLTKSTNVKGIYKAFHLCASVYWQRTWTVELGGVHLTPHYFAWGAMPHKISIVIKKWYSIPLIYHHLFAVDNVYDTHRHSNPQCRNLRDWLTLCIQHNIMQWMSLSMCTCPAQFIREHGHRCPHNSGWFPPPMENAEYLLKNSTHKLPNCGYISDSI